MYIVMAKYYLENPSVLECIFISKYGEGISSEMRSRRREESSFSNYVTECLIKIAKEREVSIAQVMRVNESCVALTVGTVLLQVKERTECSSEEVLVTLEENLGFIIKSNMEG